MVRISRTKVLAAFLVVCLAITVFAAEINLNERNSPQHTHYSGGTIVAKCGYSGWATFSDPDHSLQLVSFWLNSTYDGDAGEQDWEGPEYDYVGISNGGKAVGTGPWQTEDVAYGQVTSTQYSLGPVAWGYSNWTPAHIH